MKLVALAIGASQHRVHQLAGAESVSALRELDGLGDRGVGGNAAHVGELIDAEPQQVDHVGIEPHESAAHALGENRVDPAAMTEHSVHQLPRPAPVAGVERSDATLERLIEELPAPEIGADLGCDGARCGDSAGRCGDGAHEPSIPVVGEDGTATSRRGILPARYACRPDSTAVFIAAAIRTGS